MKSILITAAAAVATAHLHGHAHVHRAANLAKKSYVEEKIVAVTECVLDQYTTLSEDECMEGIHNGTLKFVEEEYHPKTSSAKSSTFSTVWSTSSAIPSPSPSPSPVYQPPPPPVQESPKQDQSYGQAPSYSSPWTGSTGVDTPFPDGELDCSTFPSAYGAVPVDWLNVGGWAAVQKPGAHYGSGYDNIMTVTKAQCEGGNCCLEGSYCSYACPNGYLQYQWPTLQGATGQSVGGLKCQGGKLHLTNPSVKTLCARGSSNIKVTVQNKLSQNVAICRTNYPGDEKMSIPVDVEPGTTEELACPDSNNFYQWLGKKTSAQYYINMPGYSIEKACVWGDFGDDFGNWAPGNLGVGWTDGRAWLSITANHPTQMSVTLPYTIELVGGESKCRYQNGQYCSGANYDVCSTEGCTVSSAGGELTYILS